MTTLPGNLRLYMEDRMLVAAGTGVSTYARALQIAQQALSQSTGLLVASPHRRAHASLKQKAIRTIRSLRAGAQRAQPMGDNFFFSDVYGLSQAFFSLHGRLLHIHVPGPPGIMHWSYPSPVRIVGWVNCYTVHDLIPITDPELTPISGRRHRRILAQIAQTGGLIVTVSDVSRFELAELPETAHVPCWNCSQPVAVSASEIEPDCLPDGLTPGNYFLVCGSVEPRKNIARIVSAYRRSHIGLPLVIAGPDGWRAETLSLSSESGRGIIRLPYQSRSTILTLIAQARALVFPSLAEGFGLPVIEAMALGTAVLTSCKGALAEVAGDAAHLLDPSDEAAIALGLARLANDDGYRLGLIARGRLRANAFTSEIFASNLARVYDQAARRSGLK